MQPLSVVENEGFVKFVKELDLQYQLPSCSTVTRSLLPKKYEKIKDALKCELMQVKNVALTTDLWTSNQTLSYLTLTCHYINQEMQLCSGPRNAAEKPHCTKFCRRVEKDCRRMGDT